MKGRALLYSVLPVWLMVPALLLVPSTIVRWLPDRSGFHISLEEQDKHILQCIQTGLEVRTRMEFKLCRRRSGWFDRCGDNQLLTRSVHYDPVTENYRIVTDLLNDSAPPATLLETDVDKAQKLMQDFTIPAETVLDPEMVQPGKTIYIGVRIRGYCERDEKSLFVQIPYYLTFGMFRFAGFDTGWVDYELTE